MRSTRQMSITLPNEMAQMVKEKVASGAYASESEVVRDGLRSLQERDAAVERWLRNEVASAYDQLQEKPSEVYSSEQVFDPLRARRAAAKAVGA